MSTVKADATLARLLRDGRTIQEQIDIIRYVEPLVLKEMIFEIKQMMKSGNKKWIGVGMLVMKYQMNTTVTKFEKSTTRLTEAEQLKCGDTCLELTPRHLTFDATDTMLNECSTDVLHEVLDYCYQMAEKYNIDRPHFEYWKFIALMITKKLENDNQA